MVKEDVKTGQTPLRSRCSEDASSLASLPAGSPVTIRYSISGESQTCYKVAVEIDGRTIEGYLPSSAIGGLEDFDDARHQAVWMDATKVVAAMRPMPALGSLRGGSLRSSAVVAQKAADLLDASRPQKALEVLEAELKTHRDPDLLALAGVAAWRSDDSRLALDYWRTSLEMAPRPELERLYKQVERESKGDQSNDRLYGMRVLLRYESSAVSVDVARQMTAVMDQEFARISQVLGCNAEERVIAIVQSKDAYRQTTGSMEWNGGQFDGKIRVPMFDPRAVDATLRRSLAHETAHACLTLLGQWPTWLQEGIAQKLAGDTPGPAQAKRFSDLAREGKLPRLASLPQDWTRMDAGQAGTAYAISLAAVELLWSDAGANGVGNLLRNPDRLPQVTAELDRRLGLQ
jgi:hypothetical protein